MGVQVYLYQGATRIERHPDPAGGTFDAAGDFDRLLPTSDAGFPILGRIGHHDDVNLDQAAMPNVIIEIDRLLRTAHSEREHRGLQRFRTLADLCSRTENGSLMIVGD